MADEFAKGLGILTGAGLAWMVLAGWYNNEGFEDTQLFGPNPENVDLYSSIAITLKEALFWFMIIGTLTFWVVIPAIRRGREAMANR